MKSSAEQQYLETSIATASKEELIVKIFDVLVLSSSQALEKLESQAGDIEGIHRCLLRAQRACCLLMGSLNMEIGGELSRNLFRVYEFWHHELVMANMQKDGNRLHYLLPNFKEYRDTWQEAIARFRALQHQNGAAGHAPVRDNGYVSACAPVSSFAAIG